LGGISNFALADGLKTFDVGDRREIDSRAGEYGDHKLGV
jgi:hypothetical protein